jgi:hypothetical protein
MPKSLLRPSMEKESGKLEVFTYYLSVTGEVEMQPLTPRELRFWSKEKYGPDRNRKKLQMGTPSGSYF